LSIIRPEHSVQNVCAPLEEAVFEDAFENAPHGMAVLAADGSVVRANRSLCQLLGFARTELQTLSCVHFTHPDDFQTESQQRRRLAAADIGRYELVLRYLRKDGEPVWVRIAVSAARRGVSGCDFLVVSVERLPVPGSSAGGRRGAGRSRQFSDAALSAAHEIGNSLTPLMLNTEMILEHAKKRELRESAQQIFKAARRIAFTLRRLRGVEDTAPVAYVGEHRMLDLRIIAPPGDPNTDGDQSSIPA
jgi:PAS domain S-box-containing protein